MSKKIVMKNKIIAVFTWMFICELYSPQPALTQVNQPNNRSSLSEKIDTTNLNLGDFAKKIIGNTSSNYEKAKILLDWLSNRLQWIATDYQQRSVNEILARGGGNCFELAKVYMALIKELNIKYRPIAEINIHKYSDSRQQTAETKVKQAGNTMSVFGRQHNDHRWVEIYNDITNDWEPADPSMNVIGTEQWLKARAWFGKRVTIDTSLTNDMIAPFAVFVVSDSNKSVMTENRTQHYLVFAFDKLYNNKLSNLPSWTRWIQLLDELDDNAKAAFEGKVNLHDYSAQIASLADVYEQLKKEYLDKYNSE